MRNITSKAVKQYSWKKKYKEGAAESGKWLCAPELKNLK